MGRKGEVSDIKKCLEKKGNQPWIVNNFLKLQLKVKKINIFHGQNIFGLYHYLY